MSISDKISASVSDVLFLDGEILTVVVAPSSLPALAVLLKEDNELTFDFLRSLTGMDWGETGLGVVYHFE